MSTPESSPADAHLLHERHGGVAVVFLNRPDRLNAVTPEMAGLLNSSLKVLAADPEVRAVVLSGSGRAFCVGADIKGEIRDAEAVLLEFWNPLIMTMRALDVPLIAAVNGVAAGAGASLAFACDLRIAARSARFQLSFAKIGLLPDCGATWLLPRIVGLGRANDIAMLGRDLGAEEAHSWGLVNSMVDGDETVSAAIDLGKRFEELPRTIAATKAAHLRGLDHSFEDHLRYEAAVQGALHRQPEFAEAIDAFVNKRAPRFGPRRPLG